MRLNTVLPDIFMIETENDYTGNLMVSDNQRACKLATCTRGQGHVYAGHFCFSELNEELDLR